MTDDPVKTPRPRAYDNRGRAEQARRTRARIVAAAADLLVAHGYAGTTVVAVADRAGVSPETVYKAFGTKAALTKRVYDTLLAGDDEPVAIADRQGPRDIRAEPEADGKVARYAALGRAMSARVGPLLEVLVGARGTDSELAAITDTMNEERLRGAGMFVQHLADTGGLREGLSVARATDTLWALISPEIYLLLVDRRGFTLDEYEAWLASAMGDLLLDRTRSAPPSSQ